MLVAMTSKSQVIPNIDWVKDYSFRNGIRNSSSAIDANNNAYVTGSVFNGTNKDLVVLKYDSLGTLLYAYLYNNNGDDEGNAVKVDALGNAYVTGVSYDATTGKDYITIMLSPTGSATWVNRFNNPNGNGDDEGIDLVVDYANDVVYVTGGSFSINGNNDITTIQYKISTGVFQWYSDYNGSGNGYDYPTGMVLSSNNTGVFITGSETGVSMNMVTLKINAIGALVWNKVNDGSAAGSDVGNAIVLSGANVVICGTFSNTGTNNDYATLKYDGNTGAVIWQKSYDISNTANQATGLVKDSTGNIAVIGLVLNSSTYEYRTVFYDSTGTQLWVNTESTGLSSINALPSIAMDTVADHFYITGEIQNATKDVVVYQVDPTGTTRWKKSVNGTIGGIDAGVSIVVRTAGIIYVTANSQNAGGGYDITTIKISQTPVYWPPNYNLQKDTFSYSNLFYPNTTEILDTAGNVADKILFYTKFNNPIQYILKDRMALCEVSQNTLSHIDTLSRVDMVFDGCNRFVEVHPVNYQTNGYLNYFMNHTGSAGKTNIKGASSLISPNIYPLIDLHYSSNSMGSKYFFVVKPGGNPNNIKLQFQGALSTATVNSNLKITSALGSWIYKKPDIYNVTYNNNVLGTATVTGTNGWVSLGSNTYSINPGTYTLSLPLVIEFDMGKLLSPSTTSLNCQWSTYVGGAGFDVSNEIKSNASNDLFVVGYTTSSNFPPVPGATPFQSFNGGGNDGYAEKYDQNGVRLWSTYVGGTGTDQIKSIATHTNGDIYFVGQSNSTLPTVTKSGATTSLSPLGAQDGFILQTGSTSAVKKWLTYIGGNRKDEPHRCKFDVNGNLFIVGTSESTNMTVLGSSPQYTQASASPTNCSDGFILRYNTSSQVTWATYLGASDDVANGANYTDGLRDLDFSSANDIYVVGFASGSNFPNTVNGNSTNYPANSGADGVIARFSNTGTIKYSTYMGGTGYDNFNAVRVKAGKTYLTGQRDAAGPGFPLKNSGNWFYDATSSALSDALFIAFNNNDSLLHSTYLRGNSNMQGYDIELDSTNRIYIGGITRSSIFPTKLTQPLNTYIEPYKGTSDYFLYTLRAGDTNVVWATNIGGPDDEGFFFGLGGGYIDINKQNQLHITGTTASSTVFPLFSNGGPPTYFDPTHNGPAGGLDASVTRFYLFPVNNVDGVKENHESISGLSVWPNPAQNNLMVKLDGFKEKTYFYLYNTIGQLVKSGSLQFNVNSIDLSNLSQGMYILAVKDQTHKATTKFIKNE